MGHNIVVSGYPKSIGIPRVYGSTGHPGFGASQLRSGVALVGSLLYWAWLTLYGKHFKCRTNTGE